MLRLINIVIFGIFVFSNLLLCRIIEVKKNTSLNSIKKAIEIANHSDTIKIHNGFYSEGTIIINKPLSLIGVDSPVISGNFEGFVIIVKSDSTILNGLIIENTGLSYTEDRAGIKLDSVKDCIIINCTLNNCLFAIYAASSRLIHIKNNKITGQSKTESTSGNGIHLWYCNDMLIEGNYISGMRDGIYLEFVKNTKIQYNKVEKNLRYGLHFMFSDNAVYESNEFSANGTGVAVMYTKNVLMRNNIFQNNWGGAAYGLLLKDISNSEIVGNQFNRNTTAIYVEGGGNNKIHNNHVYRNGWAIRLMANSTNNLFTMNIFSGNTFDLTANSFQLSSKFEKNYWDKYSGYDIDKDNIGDTPYRPITLFSVIIERNPTFMIFLNSFFVTLLDLAESLIPIVTSDSIADNSPLMTIPI